MDEVVQAIAIENIENGSVDCQIAITGQGFVVIGKGEIQKVRKGAKRRGKYRKVDDLTVRAAVALTSYGFKPLELMELLGLARRTAYSLFKRAKAEIERQVAASERKRREREISAASLREEWEGERGSTEKEVTTKGGYSLRSGIRSYRS